MSRTGSIRPARLGMKALAAAAVGLLASFTTGVVAVQAAPGDESHATGTYLSGTLLANLTPLQLAQLGSASADNDGTQPTQTESNPLNATVLQSLVIDIGGGLQIPLDVADAGALSSFAQAEADGSSVGASGLVGSDGAIGVGEVDPGDVPSPMTLDLSDALGAEFTDEISDLGLELGATSANAVSLGGGQPVGDYEIVGSQLVISSATLSGVTAAIDGLTDDLTTAVNLLTGEDGSLVGEVTDVASDVLGLLSLGEASASITVDLDAAVAPLLGTIDAGSGVSLNLTDGDVIVDLSVLNGGTLNGLGPNTNILTSAQLTTITTAITTRLGLLADDIESAVATALDNAAVVIDVDLDLAGVPLVNVLIEGTIAELLGDGGTFSVTALGMLPVDALTEELLDAGVESILGPLVDTTTGDLGVFINSLQTDVVNPVIATLNPLLLLLDDVLLLTVNNQEPEPAVAEQLFTETAFRLQLLPQGPIGSLLELNVAQASVGPNSLAPPVVSVTDIDPNFGPVEGGTVVTITGTCFTDATGVTFDGLPGTSFSVDSDTQITVTTPAHPEGAVDVVIQASVACGGDETVEDGFTYVSADAPVITGIVPDNGPESGGTAVVITGTGFTGATGVTFDGIPATGVSVVNDTTINATSPAHAPGLVGVVVQHPDGNSGPEDFTYTPLVSVTEIDPSFGPESGGTVVTITGTCFTGATGVLFDGVPGTDFSVDSDTQITVTTPPGTAGFVDVTILGSVACGGDEVVPDGFEYIADDAPVILSLVPDSGPYTGGTAVLVTGDGFTGATGVTFAGVPALSVVVVDDENITLLTPPNPVGPAEVRVQHPNGPSGPLTFTYLPATTIIDVDPPEGPEAGGTEVIITGSCFTGATGVLFGSTPATSFEVIDDSTIIAVAPPGVGTVDVTVLGSAECGDGSLDDGYRYIPAGLALTGMMTSLPALWGAISLIIVGLAIAVRRRSREA